MTEEVQHVPSCELSIVSTMYRSEAFLPRFLDRCVAEIRELGCSDWEIVLVNDGSPDGSLEYARARLADIPNLVIVDLSRNFGHHHAIQAGLAQSRGDWIFLIDCDLEVDPGVLRDLCNEQRRSGVDMVFGYQELRKGGWFERLTGAIFWKVLNTMTDVPIPQNMLTERLMSRRYVDALLRMGDRNLFMGGMMSWVGFGQRGIPVKKLQRAGRSSYTIRRRLQLMVNAVSSFSSKPLVWLFHTGWSITLASFCYALYLVVRKFAFGDALLGFTSVMALSAMSLGVLTTAVGVMGIYLGKVFTQVQARPTYFVREIYSERNQHTAHSLFGGPVPVPLRVGGDGLPSHR